MTAIMELNQDFLTTSSGKLYLAIIASNDTHYGTESGFSDHLENNKYLLMFGHREIYQFNTFSGEQSTV